MKKGESGLTMIVSIIVIIIILMQYLIFFVFFPHKITQSGEYIGSEIDLPLITFVKLNSDLIVKSVKNNDYNELETEINKLEFDKCWELKIKDKTFKKDDCSIKNPEMTIINIPNYDNQQIRITLDVDKK